MSGSGNDRGRKRRGGGSGGGRTGSGGRRSGTGGQSGGSSGRRGQSGRSGGRQSGRGGQRADRGGQPAQGGRGSQQRGEQRQAPPPSTGGGSLLPSDARTTVGYVVVALAVMGLGVGLMVGTVSAIGEEAVSSEMVNEDDVQPNERDLTAEEERKQNAVEQKQYREQLVRFTLYFIPLLTVFAGGFGGFVVGRRVDAELGAVAVAAGVAALVGATLFMFLGGYVAAEQFPEYEPAPDLNVGVPSMQFTLDAGSHFSNSLGAGIAGGVAGALAGVCGRKIG